ncbi:MAG: hypothetical protein ACI92I_000355 [Acidimicrobiales bacterium]|jgi:hypothetical protein
MDDVINKRAHNFLKPLHTIRIRITPIYDILIKLYFMLQSRLMENPQQSYIGKRFEFKYFLNPIEAKKVEAFLLTHARLTPDENSKNGAYFVNSLYFDTPFMGDYMEKDGSILVRKKVRARMYDDCWHDNLKGVWLEVKHKRNMNIKKTRARISGDTWKSFITHNDPHTLLTTAKADSQENKDDIQNFAHTHIRQSYSPSTVVRYKRKAYLANFTSLVRITFDYDIEACRFENASHPHNLVPVSHQAVIMEVKFNDKLPWWFTHMLAQFDLRRTDFSKYRNSVAVLRGIQRIPISK